MKIIGEGGRVGVVGCVYKSEGVEGFEKQYKSGVYLDSQTDTILPLARTTSSRSHGKKRNVQEDQSIVTRLNKLGVEERALGLSKTQCGMAAISLRCTFPNYTREDRLVEGEVFGQYYERSDILYEVNIFVANRGEGRFAVVEPNAFYREYVERRGDYQLIGSENEVVVDGKKYLPVDIVEQSGFFVPRSDSAPLYEAILLPEDADKVQAFLNDKIRDQSLKMFKLGLKGSREFKLGENTLYELAVKHTKSVLDDPQTRQRQPLNWFAGRRRFKKIALLP